MIIAAVHITRNTSVILKRAEAVRVQKGSNDSAIKIDLTNLHVLGRWEFPLKSLQSRLVSILHKQEKVESAPLKVIFQKATLQG